MPTEWFLKKGDEERGPMEYRALIELARGGAVSAGDHVRSTWHTEWQPAEAVLEQYLSKAPDPGKSQWSETVNAAVAAARSRHAAATGPQRKEGREWKGIDVAGPLHRVVRLVLHLVAWPFARFFAWVSHPIGGVVQWLAELAGGPLAWLTIGVPLICAAAGAVMAVMAVENWSSHEALAHLGPRDSEIAIGEMRRSSRVIGRRFPLVGQCTRGEYMLLLFDLAVVTGAATWVVSRALVTKEGEEE